MCFDDYKNFFDIFYKFSNQLEYFIFEIVNFLVLKMDLSNPVESQKCSKANLNGSIIGV